MLAVKLIGQHGRKGTGSGRHGSGHTVPSPSGRHLVREGVSGRFVGRSSQWQLFWGEGAGDKCPPFGLGLIHHTWSQRSTTCGKTQAITANIHRSRSFVPSQVQTRRRNFTKCWSIFTARRNAQHSAAKLDRACKQRIRSKS